MAHNQRASKRKAGKKAAPAVGVAGVVSVWLAGVTPAAASGPTGDVRPTNVAARQQIILSEEEIVDISLSTFTAFDREGGQFLRSLAVAGKARGARRCSGCRTCGSGCRACGCGSCTHG